MVRTARPDFVLLDMHLGDISGLEVVRRISEDIAARRLRVTMSSLIRRRLFDGRHEGHEPGGPRILGQAGRPEGARGWCAPGTERHASRPCAHIETDLTGG